MPADYIKRNMQQGKSVSKRLQSFSLLLMCFIGDLYLVYFERTSADKMYVGNSCLSSADTNVLVCNDVIRNLN